jgi:tripartite-type tricarboxylate transporter receptor subunit TctC
VQKLNADLIKAMAYPDIKKRLADLGRDDRSMSPAETLTFIHSEQQKWAPIVAQIAAHADK